MRLTALLFPEPHGPLITTVVPIGLSMANRVAARVLAKGYYAVLIVIDLLDGAVVKYLDMVSI